MVKEDHWKGYNRWIAAVAESRGMTVAEVDSLGRGRVWTGREALGLKLVDKLGGLDVALDEAKEKDSGIFICGDWNDVMQGRDDHRSDKGELRKEYKVGHYLDAIVDDSVAFLEPYRENLLGIGDGNHETSILRHHETNILGRVCHALKGHRRQQNRVRQRAPQQRGAGVATGQSAQHTRL